MKEAKNIIKEKSFSFTVDIVHLSKILIKAHKKFVIVNKY